ncbi:fluoride efflux transporter CrcB [Chelativorans salis]|uniref:Fluoride-specific ion channel FluC n=1 Tax=Chelativorans salis TaxID=2978478 RepID=A0ABT2LL73_9HYPH|nr:fluoride efflux transporter CrcB [Chelativorans sp. EGI FJ00035]MCT7375129.1 fluoride efflux transporter CrcB [Chelativorans sp. EGI FJ00035]
MKGRTRDTFLLYAAVAAGSMIGSVLRALASFGSAGLWAGAFPLATLLVNVAGSFLIGFYATLTGPDGRVFAGPHQRQFFMAGFCGGLTTFSMFNLETLLLARTGELTAAGLNVAISVPSWLAAVWLGHILAMRLNRLRGSER